MTAAGSGAPAPRYRTWRRALLRGRSLGGGGTDTTYVVYLVVLVGGVYSSMAWSFLTSLGLGETQTAWPVARLAPLVVAVLAAGAVAASWVGGPVWVTRREAVFALGGQFRPRAVLRARTTAVLGATAVVVALGFAALAAGGGSSAQVVAWAGWGGLMSAPALALGAAAQVPRWRAVTVGAGVAALGASVLMAVSAVPVGAAPGPAGLVVAAGLAAVSWWVVLLEVPDRLDVDDTAARVDRVAVAGAGLAGGDTAALTRLALTRYGGPRRRLAAPGGPVRVPVVVRDVVGLRRRPRVTAAALVSGVVGAWWMAPGTPAGLFAGGLLLYAAAGGWGRGLAAFFRQPVPGGLLPQRPARVLAAHLVVPGAGTAVSVALASGAAGLGPDAVGPAAVVLAVLVVAVRAWVASAGNVPATLFTPMPSPMGDMSMVVIAAYLLRGWLTVAGAAWYLAGPRGGVPGWAVVIALAAGLAWLAARRAERG